MYINYKYISNYKIENCCSFVITLLEAKKYFQGAF